MSNLDDILSQAFTDGASDTMWQADRHVEIFATAKKKLEHLIAQEANKAVVAKLNQWADFFDDPGMNAMSVSDRLRKDAAQLTAQKESK